MKQTIFILLILMSFTFFSCSDDDNDNGLAPTPGMLAGSMWSGTYTRYTYQDETYTPQKVVILFSTKNDLTIDVEYNKTQYESYKIEGKVLLIGEHEAWTITKYTKNEMELMSTKNNFVIRMIIKRNWN